MHTRRLQDGSRPDSPSPIQTLDMLDEVYYYLAPDGRLPQWNDRATAVTEKRQVTVEGAVFAVELPKAD